MRSRTPAAAATHRLELADPVLEVLGQLLYLQLALRPLRAVRGGLHCANLTNVCVDFLNQTPAVAHRVVELRAGPLGIAGRPQFLQRPPRGGAQAIQSPQILL